MSTGLWAATAAELLDRTASADPTPGGGSVAAVTGALGVGLLQMAVAVTDDPALAPQAARLTALRAAVVSAADRDVAVFDELMAAYRLPRTGADERQSRTEAIARATTAATESPLVLAETLAEALRLADKLEPLVKRGIVSDVLAGRDLITGAGRAAVRTVDINLDALGRASSPDEPGLRRRRDRVLAELAGPVA